jgi:uncharacterized protein YodC (DUF2158 family)
LLLSGQSNGKILQTNWGGKTPPQFYLNTFVIITIKTTIMAEKKFNVGDVVTLKSGSAPLTVLGINEYGTASVIWWDAEKRNFNSSDIYQEVLMPHTQDQFSV